MKPSYRTALVAGATGKVGTVLVHRLRTLGLEVHAIGRREGLLRELAETTGCMPVVLDLTDTAALEAQVAGLSIDVLVCNAGLGRSGSVPRDTAEGIDALVDVNLRATMHLVRLVSPNMKQQDRGHIVVVGSMAGHHSFAGHAAYHATKAGIAMLARQLRLDYFGRRIRVTEISPGRIRTDMFAKALGLTEDEAEACFFADCEPLLPEDLADALEYAICAPERVNVGLLELFPTMQVPGGMQMAASSTTTTIPSQVKH